MVCFDISWIQLNFSCAGFASDSANPAATEGKFFEQIVFTDLY